MVNDDDYVFRDYSKRFMFFTKIDFTELEKPSKESFNKIKAWCFSDICNQNNNHSNRKQEKKVSKSEQDCPDCGHALFWGDVSNEEN